LPLEARNKALQAAQSALAKKAKNTLVLELKGLAIFTDYFVICSGESTTQVKAIAEHIESEFAKHQLRPLSIEGLRYAHWVLMDYGDTIIHIFEEETRAYYELEKLWLDAPRIDIPQEHRPGPKDQHASRDERHAP
jgi:ribosome-associated protein